MFRLFRRNRGERLPIQSCRKYRTKDGAVSQVANKGEGNNTRSGRHHTSSTYGRLWPRMDSHLFAVREFSRGHAQSRLPESQLEPRIREVCAGRVLAQAKLRRTPFPVYVTRSASGFCGLLLLLCDLSLVSRRYGSQLVSEFFGGGCQTSDAVLAITGFECGGTFVHVRLAPSQEPINKSS